MRRGLKLVCVALVSVAAAIFFVMVVRAVSGTPPSEIPESALARPPLLYRNASQGALDQLAAVEACMPAPPPGGACPDDEISHGCIEALAKLDVESAAELSASLQRSRFVRVLGSAYLQIHCLRSTEHARVQMAVLKSLVCGGGMPGYRFAVAAIASDAVRLRFDETWVGRAERCLNVLAEEYRDLSMHAAASRAKRNGLLDFGEMKRTIDAHFVRLVRGGVPLENESAMPSNLECMTQSFDACRRARSRAVGSKIANRVLTHRSYALLMIRAHEADEAILESLRAMAPPAVHTD